MTKIPVDEQGKKVAVHEQTWYEKARNLNISILPEIYAISPLQMEYIKGNHPGRKIGQIFAEENLTIYIKARETDVK